MTQLPLVLAIPRFKGNEERIDLFTNGTALQTWMTSEGIVLPTLAKFLADNQAQIDVIGAKSVRVDIDQTFTDPEKEQARVNIGLGSAAVADEDDFATSAQGVKADNALQPKYEHTVSCSDFGAVPDCTGIGVGTDVIPAILAAVNHAITTYGDGARVVLPAGRYRAATSAILNLAGKHQVTLEFLGTITPDNVAMTMLTIRNAYDVVLKANLYLGGVFNGWVAPSPYNVNYFTTSDVVAGGGQEAFKVQGVFGFRVELKAYGYAGRVLRTTKPADVDHPDTGAISGWIETGRSMDFSEARVAQSLWADYGDVVGHGNWGALERMSMDFDYYGPVWVDLNDIEVSTIDAAFADNGPEFRGCVVVQGNLWYVGDVNNDGLNPARRHVSFIPSANRICESIDVTNMRFLNWGVGLYMDSVKRFKTSVNHNASVSLPLTTAVELNLCVDGDLIVRGNGYGQRLLKVSGVTTDNLSITAHGQDFFGTEDIIDLASTVGGTVFLLDPVLPYAAADKSRIKHAGTGVLLVVSPLLRGTTGYDLDIVPNNNVHVFGGSYLGTATFIKTAMPRSVQGLVGIANYSYGDRRINTGSNAANQGGAQSFGIEQSGFEQYLPIAQMKAKLANATPNELQGGLSMQFRPVGAAGQSLLDGWEVSHTTTDNETVGLLLTRISGAYVAKRVKVGAINTGPGAAGRALFVDN